MIRTNILADSPDWLTFVFTLVILIFLVVDLGFLNRKAHVVTTREAVIQSIFWVVISVAFGYIIYLYYPGEDGENTLKYFSAYLTEKALSVDNIFVIILILKYFRIDNKYYHKILIWGILGALIFRGVFIFMGAYLVQQFSWILYIFGVFLVYQGTKLLFENENDEIDPEKSPVIVFARKFLKITKGTFDGRFIILKGGSVLFTPLFLVLVLIETTDLIFAVDSIPAAFAITTNEFLIYTSNIFAILGLRAMFFLLASVLNKFHLLQKGLSLILIFIGAKMLLVLLNVHIPTHISFSFIFLTLALSILLSIIFAVKPAPAEEKEKVLEQSDTEKK